MPDDAVKLAAIRLRQSGLLKDAQLADRLDSLPSLPSDIDELVEELEVAIEPFAKCADELDGDADVPRAPDGEWAKFRLLTDDYRRARKARKLIAALRARQAPEGVVEAKLPYPPIVCHEAQDGSDYRVGVSEYRTADRPKGGMITFAIFLGNHRWAEAQLPPDKAAIVAQLIYSKPSVAALSAMPRGAVKATDGLSEWQGWDQSREPWGETKHKDAVLEALFRGPWSVEDAAALIGFIDRTWTKRPAGQPS